MDASQPSSQQRLWRLTHRPITGQGVDKRDCRMLGLIGNVQTMYVFLTRLRNHYEEWMERTLEPDSVDDFREYGVF